VLILATPLVGIATVFRPIIVALNAISNGAVRLFGVQPRTEANSAFSFDEVATIVATSTREGVLTDSTGTLSNAFEFTTKTVKDVLVPMPKLVTLPDDATPEDVERAVAQHGFSRYVLLDDEGEPSGYLHLKDVIDLDDDEFGEPVPPKRIRQLISVFYDAELEDALATMRRSGSHLGRAFDENGATKGVLFLEDIIEELVGEVQDATRKNTR
jgi:CBS domain containing-hemolysin-like protein